MTGARLLLGDMRVRLRELADDSVDAVVTDPPYHLASIVKRFGSPTAAPVRNADEAVDRNGPYRRASRGFMGQTWDGGDVAFDAATWAEVLRVLKPGGHLVAFGATRNYHRLAVAIEDAGFELRDMVAWLYGSGFPKSHDVSKGIDRGAGAVRDVVGERDRYRDGKRRADLGPVGNMLGNNANGVAAITAPATADAAAWDGWGTALKPALEPIALARKPLSERSVAANVLKWGTGALNVDACRIGMDEADAKASARPGHKDKPTADSIFGTGGQMHAEQNPLGRWPANLCHDGSAEVLAGFPDEAGGGFGKRGGERRSDYGFGGNLETVGFGDSGSAARFFYCAKATTEERGPGNGHPTVKPVALLCWLVRLVTPPGGIVLDPFLGSGSTGVAADICQAKFVGIELKPDYMAIAERRMVDRAGLFADVAVDRGEGVAA